MDDKSNIVLHHVFQGGSDATTALFQLNNQFIVRKYSAGDGAVKLHSQCQWIKLYQTQLPLVSVINAYQHEPHVFYYDMCYWPDARDFFDVIQVTPQEASWRLLESVLKTMILFHQENINGVATSTLINRYVDTKILANFSKIKALATLLFKEKNLMINGKKIDLKKINHWISDKNFDKRFSYRNTSVIHGDLTIDNILIKKDFSRGWFLIDPNVENIFESPLIDFAKILQSLHLGYESLRRNATCSMENGNISFNINRSAQYEFLFYQYSVWLEKKFGGDYVREVMLHEIVHYLRLTPYKFRKSFETGIVFSACTLLLMQEYLEKFEPC